MVSKAEEQQVPKKKKSILWIFTFLAFVAMSTGTFGFFHFEGKNLADQITAADMRSVTLPSFTVKLADTSSRYLKITITLESPSKKVEKELTESSYKVEDSVIKVLRNTSTSNLDDPQKTDMLKQELLNGINAVLTSGKVTGLYFDEFIIQ